MKFSEAYNSLQKDPVFLDWQIDNPEHYMAHGFIMLGGQVVPEWQIGYYNKREDRIIVFTIGDAVTMNPPSEVFKKDSGVRELVLDGVYDSEEALAAAEKVRKEKYKGHEPIKTIMLLQHLKQGQVWNITFVTQTFSVCNIKLEAETLTVLSDSCDSLLGWGSAVPGERK